ncbi:MAG: amino acid adenylation domain-containing protein, partial [bacterium]|nr:amino acid adenylation domain-containing protein [bacterium]
WPFPSTGLIECFQQQVEKKPDAIAVVHEHNTLTYNELNRRANSLAHYLAEKFGIRPGHIVAVSVERSLEMIVSIMGVLKAGAAYLAIDPTYPGERISYMLKDSNAQHLIIDEEREEQLREYFGNIIDIKKHREEINSKAAENTGIKNAPADVLYVAYTSGSTGIPHGAIVSHQILSNLIRWQNEKTPIDASMCSLQFASINFDVSFQEIMTTLTSGGQLYLIDEMKRKDCDYLIDFLTIHGIHLLYLPFYYLNFLFTHSNRLEKSTAHRLEHIITAGEQLVITPGLKTFLESNPGVKLHNHYGPAEMHVVTSYTLEAATVGEQTLPPIGKAISNTAIYILDDYYKPVPIGVWGELYICGCADFSGYINHPELTAQKTTRHPELSSDSTGFYSTGDIGKWNENGNIELKGRKDSQVKIRG